MSHEDHATTSAAKRTRSDKSKNVDHHATTNSTTPTTEFLLTAESHLHFKLAPHTVVSKPFHLSADEVNPKADNYGPVTTGVYTSSSVWATGAPLIWRQGIFRKDYVQDGVPSTQFGAHGTHCAGLIAAKGTLYGVAPEVALADYRVFGTGDEGASFDVIATAVRDAAEKADIISMSLGGPVDAPVLREAIKYAVNQKNRTVIVASGNSGTQSNQGIGAIDYPSFYPEVISVGAVQMEADGKISKAYFSNANKEVDICADGFEVISTVPGGKYANMSGTSMATPIVAGFAALLLAKARSCVGLGTSIGDTELFPMIKANTVDIPDPQNRGSPGPLGSDWLYGAGFATFYPEIPRGKGKIWSLPNIGIGAPDAKN